MSIGDLGSLGEFLGSIVVLLTLGYLAIQTRAGRQATELQTFMALNSHSVTMMAALLSSKPNALDAWQRGQSEKLDDEDTLKLYGLIHNALVVSPVASILHAAPSPTRTNALSGYEGLIQASWANPNFVTLWDAGQWSYLIDDQRKAIEAYRAAD